jgi:hypothetical protein
MRVVFLFGFLLALSGCANERAVTFIYYPTRAPGDTFPTPSQFSTEAQKECARYGLVAVHDWDNWTDFQRIRSNWRCVQRS